MIPAKNEASRIERTVESFCRYFGDRASVLVVANACSDETASVVRGLASRYDNLRLLEIAASIGKGGAVRAGLTLGTEPYLAFVDADCSTPPDQLDVLLRHCQETKANGAIGSRWLPGSRISRRQPLRRRVASRIFNLLVRALFGLHYTDTQCGAKVFERSTIDRVLNRLEIANFAFDVDLLFCLKQLGCRIDEIAISWDDVPDYSKVFLLKSGSSMAASIARLRLRHGIFRHVPWADMIARSTVIPVRSGLEFLVIRGERPDAAATTKFLEEAERQGHTIHVAHVRSFVDAVIFIAGYVRRGHRAYDALVDLTTNEGLWFLRLSTKPKVLQAMIEALSANERPLFIERLAERCGFRTFFHRAEDGWTLSSARVEMLLQDSI